MATAKNVEIIRCISILPSDYGELDNKPSINGIIIDGHLKSQDLKLMSSNIDDYQTIDKAEIINKYIPVIDEDGAMHKILVSELVEYSNGNDNVVDIEGAINSIDSQLSEIIDGEGV